MLVLIADIDSFGFVGLVVDVEDKTDFIHGLIQLGFFVCDLELGVADEYEGVLEEGHFVSG